jgi:hypothetical protein
MTGRAFGRGLAAAASAVSLAWGLGAALPAAAGATGPSDVCSAVGLPSDTQTIGVSGVFHVTAFTCGDATATGFQQCPSRTVAVPDVFHTTLWYCVPFGIGITYGPSGVQQTVMINGVGGVSVGTG